MQRKVVLITGASSGFGYELAKKLAKLNHIVYGVARRKDKLQGLEKYGVNIGICDVQKDEDVKSIVNRIIMEQGRIDIVYCNAGYGYYNIIEHSSIEEAKKQFDVNVFGVHRVVKEVLPYMRDNGEGRVVITTSVVANVSLPIGAWYCASKHAVRAYAEGLMLELNGTGVDVITIEPGHVKTEFDDISRAFLKDIEVHQDYENIRDNYVKFLEKPSIGFVGLKRTVKDMVHAGLSTKPKMNYKTTLDSKSLTFIRSILGRENYYKLVAKVLK